METLGKPRPINDLIYQYVYITPLEENIIDLPIFQRLRFIKQNSACYLTFPSNKLDRFSHSLGVMHLGGEMLVNACQNTTADVIEEFIREAQKEIFKTCKSRQAYAERKKAWMERFGNISNFNFNFLHKEDFIKKIIEQCGAKGDPALHNDDYIFTFNVIWQSLRIACCLHDVGHFPYSHIFEKAVENFFTNDETYSPQEEVKKIFDTTIERLGFKLRESEHIAVHEQISTILIAENIVPTTGSTTFDDLSRLCIELGLKIFLTYRPKSPEGSSQFNIEDIFYCLHTIISSDLDADRMDYTMRDCFYAGLDVGKFDYLRLLNALKLKKLNYNGQQHFEIVVNGKAISSLEQFFHQRFILYKYFIYHHNNSRYNGILIEIIKLLIPQTVENGPLTKLLEEFHFFSPHAKTANGETKLLNLDIYHQFEDGWLRTLLIRVRERIQNIFDDPKESQENSSQHKLLKRLQLLIDTFTFRKTKNVISLWKRDHQADQIIKDIIDKLNQSKLTSAVLKRFSLKKEQLTDKEKIRFVKEKLNTLIAPAFDNVIPLPLVNIQKKLDQLDKDVTLIYNHAKPKIFDTPQMKDGNIVDGNSVWIEMRDYGAEDSGYINIKCYDASVYLQSLQVVSDNLFHHQFAFVSDKIKEDKKLIALCREIVIDSYKEYLDIIINPSMAIVSTNKKAVISKQDKSKTVHLDKKPKVQPAAKIKKVNP